MESNKLSRNDSPMHPKDTDLSVDAETQKLLLKKAMRTATVGGSVKWNTLAWNWLHQCFFYLNPSDMVFKVFVELVLLIACYGILSFAGCRPVTKIAVSLLLAHTLNWVLNGNFWACLLSALPFMRNRGVTQTQAYVNAMAVRLRASESVDAMMLLGSVCRSQWHSRSDIDVRILRKGGVKSAVCALGLTLKERVLAVAQRQPLEIYLADSVEFLAKKRKDEVPVFLICKNPEAIPFASTVLPELPPFTADSDRGLEKQRP